MRSTSFTSHHHLEGYLKNNKSPEFLCCRSPMRYYHSIPDYFRQNLLLCQHYFYTNTITDHFLSYNSSTRMKWLAYTFSFTLYVLYRVLRVSYAFVKPYFKAQLGVSNLLLGLLDAFTYFAQATGQGMRYLLFEQLSKMHQYFLIGALFLSGCFSLFPTLSLLGIITQENASYLLTAIMLMVGFWSFNIFLSLFAILHEFFSNQQNGGAIGFWIASGDIGIALGYLVPSVFIVTLGVQWEVPLLFVTGLFAIFSILLFLLVPSKYELSGEIQESKQSITFSEFWEFTKNQFHNPDYLLYIAIVCFAKPLFFGLMQWLPTFVHSQGETQYSGQISVMFIVTTVIGSWAIGKFYQRETTSEQEQKLKTKQLFILAIVCLVTIACGFLYICFMESFSIIDFLIVLCIEGFTLGGLINVLVCNQILKMGNGDSRRTEMINTLSNVIGNAAVGLVHLTMGVCMGEKEKKGESDNPYIGVFYVLFILSVLLLCLYVVKGIIMFFGSKEEITDSQQYKSIQGHLEQLA